MAKHIVINGKNYRNVSKVELPTSDGGTALFRDAEEVMEVPTETLPISANGEYNVKDYAAVQVAVPTEGAEPVLAGIAVNPTSVTIPYNATSDELYTYLTSMVGTYTLSGYTGSLERDLTAHLSALKVVGNLPSMGDSATVTLSYGGKTTDITVTVEEGGTYIPVTGITLSQSSAELKVGDTLQLTATVLPENATYKQLLWYSSSDSVTVGDGLVTALSPISSATIYVQSIDDSTIIESCTIKVNAINVDSITISPASLSLKVGETAELSYSFTPLNATNPSFDATASSELEVVSHDTANRKVVIKAISEGGGAVTVADTDYSASATCIVTVEAAEATETNYWVSESVTGGNAKTITFPMSDFDASDFEQIKYIDITGDKNNTNALGTELARLRLVKESDAWTLHEAWMANQSAAVTDSETLKSVSFSDSGLTILVSKNNFGAVRNYRLTCYDEGSSLPVANANEAYDKGLYVISGGSTNKFAIMARKDGGLIKQADGFTSIVIAEGETSQSPSYSVGAPFMQKLALNRSGDGWSGTVQTSLENMTVASATVEVSEDEVFGNSIISITVRVTNSAGNTVDLGFFKSANPIGTVEIS